MCSLVCDFSPFQVIKNPVTDHLPTGCLKVGTSFHAGTIVDVRKFAQDKPVVFVIGSMAHGKVGQRSLPQSCGFRCEKMTQ